MLSFFRVRRISQAAFPLDLTMLKDRCRTYASLSVRSARLKTLAGRCNFPGGDQQPLYVPVFLPLAASPKPGRPGDAELLWLSPSHMSCRSLSRCFPGQGSSRKYVLQELGGFPDVPVRLPHKYIAHDLLGIDHESPVSAGQICSILPPRQIA